MANNRLYIRCRGCRESMMITKNFGEPFCLDKKKRWTNSTHFSTTMLFAATTTMDILMAEDMSCMTILIKE